MNTLREIVFDIKEKLELSSDDSNLSNEYIVYLIKNYRVKFVRQRLGDIRRNVSLTFKQPIELDLINTKNALGETITTSTVKVPKILDINSIDNRTILSTNNSMVKSFNMISYKRLPYVGTRYHMKELVYGAIGDDNKLYINSGNGNHKMLDKVKLYGIFEDPEEAWKLSPEYNSNVEFWDTEYPLEPSLLPDIVEYIVAQLANTPGRLPEDKINNGEQDT